MPKVLDALRANSAYAFLVVAAVWLALAVVAGSILLLWPVIACAVSGVMLKARPGHRFTWAWVIASAVLGLLISAYRVYAWVPFLSGAFATTAGISLAAFAVLAAAHVFLLYAGWSRPKAVKSD